MKRFDENGSPPDEGGVPNRDGLEGRIRELEAENAQLRAKLEQVHEQWDLDRQALEWYHAQGLPKTEAEVLEGKGHTISEVLAECDREFGNERR
jgi:septation ring formation regulator EzrA